MLYDRFVYRTLPATGSTLQNPPAAYYKVLRDPDAAMENTTQLFLAVRFNCNKCHDHPFEKWTQNQYYQFGAYFARVGTKNGEMPGEQIIFAKYDGGEVKHPKTDMDVAPKVPVGSAKEPPKEGDRREV